MNILFIHRNFPGQFLHLATHLATRRGVKVVGLGEAKNIERGEKIPGVSVFGYRHVARPAGGHSYLRSIENQVRQRQSILRALLDLKKKGFAPHIICVHLSLLQVSTVHAYLTYPFVLSWSFLEAMATGCVLVASRTAPVEEVIEHGHNGLLLDFFDSNALTDAVSEVLADPGAFAAMRGRARETVQRRYELNDICLPGKVAMLEGLAERAIGLQREKLAIDCKLA